MNLNYGLNSTNFRANTAFLMIFFTSFSFFPVSRLNNYSNFFFVSNVFTHLIISFALLWALNSICNFFSSTLLPNECNTLAEDLPELSQTKRFIYLRKKHLYPYTPFLQQCSANHSGFVCEPHISTSFSP